MASSSGNLNNATPELESECPICLHPFDPPVYQCNNGHVICHDCLSQCKECSICRQPMPKDKVRNLQFEKMLVWASNGSIPCPRRGDGCNVVVKMECVEKHLHDDCAYVPRKLCLRLGIPGGCGEEYCTGKSNQLIEHLFSAHKLTGSSGEGNDLSSSSTLELPGAFVAWELEFRILELNFIRFDNKMFFIKKYCNTNELLYAIVVCMNEPLTTARKYSAVVQLASTGVPNVLEFKQREIVLLTDADEVICLNPKRKFKYHHIECCKVPFSTLEHYDRTIGGGRKLRYKARVTIFKNMD